MVCRRLSKKQRLALLDKEEVQSINDGVPEKSITPQAYAPVYSEEEGEVQSEDDIPILTQIKGFGSIFFKVNKKLD